MLLKMGMGLDERSIRRLKELRLRELWIRYPGAEFACEYICPAVFEAQAALTWQVSRALEAVSQGAHARLEYAEYRAAITGLLTRLIANPQAAVFIQELVGREDQALRHASSVCLLSLLMGLKLDDYLISERSRLGANHARDVTSLGVGAMLHDIGMLRLDPAVVQKWSRSLDESDLDWRRHVFIGYEMVKETIGPAAAAGILHHHQKFDGSGFPRRVARSGQESPVRGSDIHVFARIIAAADLYDRIRWAPSAPVDEPPVPIVRVLRRMQEDPYRRWIDPMIFVALLSSIPAYAPGSVVTLSDGRSGIVVEWYPDDPCRPTVALTGDPAKSSSRHGNPQRVSLREHSKLTIVHAEGEDVSADNFYPQSPGQYDLRLARKSIANSAARGNAAGEMTAA
jgi:HD-GYP domain-containing protein (c-di-GMP phosphodiesterase class II)